LHATHRTSVVREQGNAANWFGGQMDVHCEHTVSDVGVASATMYAVALLQSVMDMHTRSLERLGEDASYSFESQTVQGAHVSA